MKKKLYNLQPITYNLERKKSLGQHFLQSAHYLTVIADAAAVQKGEMVVEVGPGEGALTAVLLARGARVTAIEKDHRLIPILQEKFAQEIAHGQLSVVEADALEFNPSGYTLSASGYKVVANIPYYITGALLRIFLEASVQPSTIVFLVQKEVAERIARHGAANKVFKESILSLSVKAYGTPTYVKTVPRGAFAPPPTVDSAILLIENVSRNNFANNAQEEMFFELVKNGFAQKRKLLASNLKIILGEEAVAKLEKAGIPPKARAEDVPLKQWLALCKIEAA